MILKIITEVLIMWILYAIYMAILVHGKGPVGGIFFYPMAMQDRVVELGLTTKDKIKRGKSFAFVLSFVWMFVALFAHLIHYPSQDDQNGISTFFCSTLRIDRTLQTFP